MTLREIIDEVKAGKSGTLLIDNDATYWGPMEDGGGQTGMMPREVLEQALDLLGVPWEDA